MFVTIIIQYIRAGQYNSTVVLLVFDTAFFLNTTTPCRYYGFPRACLSYWVFGAFIDLNDYCFDTAIFSNNVIIFTKGTLFAAIFQYCQSLGQSTAYTLDDACVAI